MTGMTGANLAPTSLVCVAGAGAASSRRAARLRMVLASSSPTSSREEQNSVQQSAASACCRFEAVTLAEPSVLAGQEQEPCLDGLCVNEAREPREGEEALLPQKSEVYVGSDGLKTRR